MDILHFSWEVLIQCMRWRWITMGIFEWSNSRIDVFFLKIFSWCTNPDECYFRSWNIVPQFEVFEVILVVIQAYCVLEWKYNPIFYFDVYPAFIEDEYLGLDVCYYIRILMLFGRWLLLLFTPCRHTSPLSDGVVCVTNNGSLVQQTCYNKQKYASHQWSGLTFLTV